MDSHQRFLAKATTVADITLAGGGAVSVLVLSYFFYYYAWTQERQFTSSLGMVFYYAVPLLLAGVLFSSLLLRPSYKRNIALALFSIGTSVYVAETIATIWSHLPSVLERTRIARAARTAKLWGVAWDTRSQREVITDLRAKGINAYPAIINRLLLETQLDGRLRSPITMDGGEVLPLGGISNKTTVFCNENGYYVTYQSDEHGFHNPQEIWNSGHIDIVALGDSFTQGFCVPSDKNFVALIRQRYPATLNLGIAGNGPLLMLATLKEYVQFIKPKAVLWFYWEANDLVDLKMERNSPLLMRYLDADFNQGLLNRQPNIDNGLIAYVDRISHTTMREELVYATANISSAPGIVQLVKLGQLRNMLGLIYGETSKAYGLPNYMAVTDVRDLFTKVLIAAKGSVDSWGGTLYFVYLPTQQHYRNPTDASDYLNPAFLDRDHEQVLALAKTIGLPVIDVHNAFRAHADVLALFPFRQPRHYSTEGNQVVAEAVLHSNVYSN
jgi:hypothetical protein